MKTDTRTFFAAVVGIPLLLAGATGTHAIFAPSDAVAENTPSVVESPQVVVARAPDVAPPVPEPQAPLISLPAVQPETVVQEVFVSEPRQDDSMTYEYEESEQEDGD